MKTKTILLKFEWKRSKSFGPNSRRRIIFKKGIDRFDRFHAKIRNIKLVDYEKLTLNFELKFDGIKRTLISYWQ